MTEKVYHEIRFERTETSVDLLHIHHGIRKGIREDEAVAVVVSFHELHDSSFTNVASRCVPMYFVMGFVP